MAGFDTLRTAEVPSVGTPAGAHRHPCSGLETLQEDFHWTNKSGIGMRGSLKEKTHEEGEPPVC